MSKNADLIAIWCSLFSYSGRHISADQFGTPALLSPLIEAGWLVPIAHAATVPCEACDQPHWADVVLVEQEFRGICRRSGEAFAISRSTSVYRVDGDAFSASVARSLALEGGTRRVRGLDAVWSLGILRLNQERIAIFCTPSVSRVDLATTILDSIAGQVRTIAHCLIVADEIGTVRLLQRNSAVIRFRDVATISPDGTLAVDDAQILANTFPDINRPRRSGRPANQRERILKLLDESGSGGPIDTSNDSLREWGRKFKIRFRKDSPAASTIRNAITVWNLRRGFGSSSG